jgi:protein-disulfide isomerase
LSFHKRGRPTAIAAHCAAKNSPSKYWHFYDHFYTDKSKDKLSDKSITELAKKVGLNMKTFNKCIKSKDVAAVVEKNFQSGQKYGITGTPSFFIDGYKKGGVTSYAAFKQIIDRELAAKSKLAKKSSKG